MRIFRRKPKVVITEPTKEVFTCEDAINTAISGRQYKTFVSGSVIIKVRGPRIRF